MESFLRISSYAVVDRYLPLLTISAIVRLTDILRQQSCYNRYLYTNYFVIIYSLVRLLRSKQPLRLVP